MQDKRCSQQITHRQLSDQQKDMVIRPWQTKNLVSRAKRCQWAPCLTNLFQLKTLNSRCRNLRESPLWARRESVLPIPESEVLSANLRTMIWHKLFVHASWNKKKKLMQSLWTLWLSTSQQDPKIRIVSKVRKIVRAWVFPKIQTPIFNGRSRRRTSYPVFLPLTHRPLKAW